MSPFRTNRRSLALVDDVDETARQIGAVNTVWLEAGRLCATNTDSLRILGEPR
jgi:shikimate 5-dehydrogenase